MRLESFRVAFIGGTDGRYAGLLARFSPALTPLPCRDWTDLEPRLATFRPDLIAVLPGAAPHPPLGVRIPIVALDATSLALGAEALEVRLLTAQGMVASSPLSKLLGRSDAMARVRGSLVTIARTGLPLLLTGENGTGKDLAAQIAHELSERAGRAFVAVNCGAVPPGLAESEFFGSVRGAFTGAENRTGFCQQALGGTLFLDEVAELPTEIQAKLLRVLENHEIRRVGSGRVETADFRLICATNQNLAAEVRAGRFREDLYYRINVLSLKMPALRDRKEDLPGLVRHFLDCEELGRRTVTVGTRALTKLMDYHWPGNLRQLRNVVLRAAVLNESTELLPEHLEWET